MRLDHITPKQFGVRLQVGHIVSGVETATVKIANVITSRSALFGFSDFHSLPTSEFCQYRLRAEASVVLPGGYSECEPPDPIPNSEVKPFSADDSMGASHAKVGHRQASNRAALAGQPARAFYFMGVSSCKFSVGVLQEKAE